MSSIITQGSSSGTGSMTLAAPVTNSNQTATLPDATGTVMVSGNMPTFSAYLATAQTGISTGVATKVNFDTEEWDTNNNFASSRFTPTVAGYYQLNSRVALNGSTITSTAQIYIYKNGSLYKTGERIDSTSVVGMVVNSLVYLNGSTDYVEIYGLMTGTGLQFYGASADTYSTWFNGSMVRAS